MSLNACSTNIADPSIASARPAVITPNTAKELLIKGNASYLANDKDSALRLNLSTNGQHPYAVVITCSDSRAIPEIAFNASFGDLFTIRTAGNVIYDFETGSVEYGTEHLGSTLIVVMGHTNCGAVTAACLPDDCGHMNHINDIIDEIFQSVAKAKANGSTEQTLLNDAIILNVQNSIDMLREQNSFRNGKRRQNKNHGSHLRHRNRQGYLLRHTEPLPPYLSARTAFSYHFAPQNPILTKTSKMRHIQSRQDLPE